MGTIIEWRTEIMQPDDYFTPKNNDGGYTVFIDTSQFTQAALLAWNEWNYYMTQCPEDWKKKAAEAARAFTYDIGVSPDAFLCLAEDLEEKLNQRD